MIKTHIYLNQYIVNLYQNNPYILFIEFYPSLEVFSTTTILNTGLIYLMDLLIFILLNLINAFKFKTLISDSFFIAVKFLTLIGLLIFIRGGIPRYRYDFLTKIGWIKFLSLVLSVFLSTLLITYIY